MKPSSYNHLRLVLLGVVWGSAFVSLKTASTALTPSWLLVSRLGLTTLALLPLALVRRQRHPLAVRWRDFAVLVFLSLVGLTIPFWMVNWAILHLDTAVTSILNSTMPLFVLPLSFFLLQEPTRPLRLLGVLLGFVGVVVLSAPPDGDWSAAPPWPALFVVLAAFCYALGTVVTQRWLLHLDTVVLNLFQFGLAALWATLAMVVVQDPLPAWPTPWVFLSLLHLGLICSAAAMLVWLALLRDAGSPYSSLVTYLIPVVAVLIGFLVLDERLDTKALVGTGLVLVGVLLAATVGNPARSGLGQTR